MTTRVTEGALTKSEEKETAGSLAMQPQKTVLKLLLLFQERFETFLRVLSLSKSSV